MSNIARIMQQAAAGAAAGELLAIEDVFSTYLYTGNGSTQTITNGIDLAGEGGMVWIKSRSDAVNNVIVDTERVSGTTDNYLMTNITNPQVAHHNEFGSFTSTGFTIPYNTEAGYTNFGTRTYASWTWRKAPRWFDVVTYTGNSVAGRQIAHNLSIVPGCIIFKSTSNAGSWLVWHRYDGSKYFELNSTNAAGSVTVSIPTSDVFTIESGANGNWNTNGVQYVAYLFAHDPLGPSGDGSDGLIACGSYTGTGANNNAVNIGWEPQWLLWKPATTTGDWQLVDAMRGFTAANVGVNRLEPNTADAESLSGTPYCDISATGFVQSGSSTSNNSLGQTYIYIAIRRGPMREPTSGTEVFAVANRVGASGNLGSYRSGFPVDMAFHKVVNNSINPYEIGSRLTQGRSMNTTDTSAEVVQSDQQYGYMDGWSDEASALSTKYSWMWRRAPGFFDVVAYTGNGVAGRTVPHNLGVAPELMIAKPRDQVRGWPTYWLPLGPTFTTYLNSTGLPTSGPNMWNSTNPSDTNFTVGNDADINANGFKYIAYLFSTLAGISKVGSYTGNGSSQTIDCGFTSGARFILIKRTDDNDDWYVWDTARGIVAGNDPHLSLNTTAAQVTTNDSIDPDSSGFIVNQLAATNINVSSASYIYLAIS